MRAQLEPISSAKTSRLHSRNICDSAFCHPFHYHPEIELAYIVRSQGTRLVGDHVGSFSEGDLCLIGRNLPHLYTNVRKPADGAEAEVLQFRRDFAGGFIDATTEMLPFARLLDNADLGLSFDPGTAAKAGKLIRQIRLLDGFSRLKRFMDLIDCLIHSEAQTTLASPGYSGAITTRNCERMQPVYCHIMEHFNEEVDHSILASKANLAPASFCRLFKRLTRKTCTEFINEVRLGQACRLLLETENSITNVAFACGFGNLSSFNRRFKERYGCNPRSYRKSNVRCNDLSTPL